MSAASGLAEPEPPPQPQARAWRLARLHPVLAFLLRRLLIGVATLLAASLMIFFATSELPGDVAQVVLGKSATPATLASLRKQLDLDHPFVVRYWHWLEGVVHGDLGDSAVELAESDPHPAVAAAIGQPLLDSFILAAITMVLLAPLALALGVLAAMWSGRAGDYAVSTTVLVLSAFPEFVLGTLLILLFFSELHLLPPVALVAPGASPLGHPNALVLPVLTLLGTGIGFAARQTRAGMANALDQAYVAQARLNGLPSTRVLWRYALRNTLAPSVQALAQTTQYLVGGIIVVEAVYDYPGIGSMLVQAVSARDVTEVAGIAIVLAAIYILINILADLAVVLLVPRLKTALR